MQKPYWQQWTCSKLLKLLLVLLFVQSYAKVELNDLHLNLNVEKFQLENGISVCLIARHRSPIVMQQVWYNVGSGDEHDGITGVSHFLEHMMFKGTPLYPSGAFNQELKKIGAQYNAFTSQDFTVYHEIVLRENLEKVINLEADRMRNLDIELSLMEKERKVITEERRSRTEDDPYALARESFYLHAYEGNPYQSPVIGHMRSIHNVTKAKLQHWYNSYYTPSNVTLIYIGDIKKKELKQLLLKSFSGIASTNAIVAPQYKRHEPTGYRYSELRKPVRRSKILVGYNVPSVKTAAEPWEPYALSLLSSLLTSGKNSILEKELVYTTGVATTISSGYNLLQKYETLFEIHAVPRDKSVQGLQKVQAAIESEIEAIKLIPPDPKRLERMKVQEAAAQVYQLDNAFEQGYIVGTLEAQHLPWEWYSQYPRRLQAITPKQIQQVARKYLQRSRETVTYIVASKGGQK